MVFLFQMKTVPRQAAKEKTYTFDALPIIMHDTGPQKFNGPKLKNGKLLGEVVNDVIVKNKIKLNSVTTPQLNEIKKAVGDSIYKVYIQPNVTENKK